MARAVTWGKVIEVCKERGIEIFVKGSERKLKGKDAEGKSRVMTIGHECCKNKSSVLWPDYASKFKRAFGVSNDELHD